MIDDISLLFCNKTECQRMGLVKWAVFFSSSQWALTQGCHFPDNMKSPDFSRARLSSRMCPRSFINLAENEFQTTKFQLTHFCHKLPDCSGKLLYFQRSLSNSLSLPGFQGQGHAVAILQIHYPAEHITKLPS